MNPGALRVHLDEPQAHERARRSRRRTLCARHGHHLTHLAPARHDDGLILQANDEASVGPDGGVRQRRHDQIALGREAGEALDEVVSRFASGDELQNGPVCAH